jgi:hypothetical protein
MVLFWASLCLSFSRVFIKSSLLDWVWFKFNPWQAPRFPRSSRLVVENRPLGRRSMYKWYSHGKWSNICRRAMFDYQTVYSQCCSLKTAFLASNPHCVPRITQALRAIVAGHYQHRVSTRLRRSFIACRRKKNMEHWLSSPRWWLQGISRDYAGPIVELRTPAMPFGLESFGGYWSLNI